MFESSLNYKSCHVPRKNLHCVNITPTNSPVFSVDSPNRQSVFILLSQNPTSCWITLTILFIFISLNLILYHLEQLVHFHQRENKSIEMIDFTNENEYRLLENEEFQVRYGSRALIHQVKPYDLYGEFREEKKRRKLLI